MFGGRGKTTTRELCLASLSCRSLTIVLPPVSKPIFIAAGSPFFTAFKFDLSHSSTMTRGHERPANASRKGNKSEYEHSKRQVH